MSKGNIGGFEFWFNIYVHIEKYTLCKVLWKQK
jgi:hypothetical protein